MLISYEIKIKDMKSAFILFFTSLSYTFGNETKEALEEVAEENAGVLYFLRWGMNQTGVFF